MLNKDSFRNFMHMAASVTKTPACANHSTAQLIEDQKNSQVSYRNLIPNLQTQHILTSQSYSCVAKPNSTVMVILMLNKTILNEKVCCHFCQVILLFWLWQKVLPNSGVARGEAWGPRALGGTFRGATLRWPKIYFSKEFKSSSFSLLF